MKVWVRIAAIPLALALMGASDQSCASNQNSGGGSGSRSGGYVTLSLSCHAHSVTATAAGGGWNGHDRVTLTFTIDGGDRRTAGRTTERNGSLGAATARWSDVPYGRHTVDVDAQGRSDDAHDSQSCRTGDTK